MAPHDPAHRTTSSEHPLGASTAPTPGFTSRQRLRAALAHRTLDRIPFDFGGTDVTGIHVVAYRALRRHLALPAIEPQIADVVQQLAEVDDDVLQLLQVDVANVVERDVAGEWMTEHEPAIVGLSCLLTTTMPMMPATVEAAEQAGARDRVRILIGGAPVTQEYAEKIRADAYAPNAAAAVEAARSLLS